MPLTHEQKKKYLRKRGSQCPHCGSANIEGGSPQVDGSTVAVSVTCEDCGKQWEDEYHLVGINEV